MKTARKLFLLAFILFMLLPAIEHFVHVVHVDEVNEHRKKIEWPGGRLLRSIAVDKTFAGKVEAYFADNFPLRDLLLRLHGQLEYSLLGVAREVIVGTDGWLSDRKLLAEHLPQLDRLDEHQVQAGILQIKRLQHWLGERNVRFLMVIVPLKPTVYPEQYPRRFQRTADRIGLEVFQEAMALNGIPYVDVLAEFRRRKDEEPLFYKTDMHWNSVGVSHATRAIVDRLSNEILGKPLWAEDLRRTEVPFQGDESKAIPLLFPLSESVQVLQSREAAYAKDPVQRPDLEVFHGTDPARAVLPPSIMFGNSFMLAYPGVGYHHYFAESSRVLDYQYFGKVLDAVQPQHRIFILHIYETQLQYHVMPSGQARASSGFAQYWDPRIAALPLPPGFRYRSPAF